ncbi:hypothetical protein PF003_g14863 [Phytophthora fragariae]|nr:hypothetical protein PF003_g14863 [Phytophthora fragariae]
MMKVFSAPASTAGVERHHKVAKRLADSLDDCSETHAGEAHDESVLRSSFYGRR